MFNKKELKWKIHTVIHFSFFLFNVSQVVLLCAGTFVVVQTTTVTLKDLEVLIHVVALTLSKSWPSR